jgi:RNA polymerase sigma-70 factor, ECF subfamily
MVRAFVLSLQPDLTLADDIVQETFLMVSRKAHEFELGTSFVAWVRAIARFKILEALRRKSRRFEVLSDDVIEMLCAAEAHVDAAQANDTDRRLALLAQCMDALAPTARRMMELRYQRAYRLPEIARELNWTVGALKVALSRARAVMRVCVERRLAQAAN